MFECIFLLCLVYKGVYDEYRDLVSRITRWITQSFVEKSIKYDEGIDYMGRSELRKIIWLFDNF
jgi:hypothetical protein